MAFTTKAPRFNIGMGNDIREGFWRILKHFDAITYPTRLVPFKSSESGQDTLSRQVFNMVAYNNRVYGLGQVTGPLRIQIYYKDTFTDGTWSTTANSTSAVTQTTFNNSCFVYHKGFFYGAQHNQSLFKYDPTGAVAFNDAFQSFGATFTIVNQGVVHPQDQYLYIPWDNNIASLASDGTTWNATALTLKTEHQITSICEYGSYLAIAVRDTTSGLSSPSKVFLWDRSSSVNTSIEPVDWGLGDLYVLENLEGVLIGVSKFTDVDDTTALTPKLIIRRYNGGDGAEQVMEMIGTVPGANATNVYLPKLKVNNRLYFLATLAIDGVYQTGVWSFGRATPTAPYALTIDRLPNNDTAVTALDGFCLIGSYMFIAYNSDGSISKTDNTSVYTATSIAETGIFNQVPGLQNSRIPDSSVKKKLIGVTVTYTPLTSSGQVVLKYKKDSDSSWTTIFTDTTLNALSHSSINIESTGVTLPEYQEIRFRIESTGGAEITGFEFDAEVTDKRPY